MLRSNLSLVLGFLPRAISFGLAIFVATPASAGPIDLGVWYEFTFTDPGVPAVGCDPADPGGNFAIPSSGTPTTFLDAPPWTIDVPAAGAILTVTDAFLSGDRFEAFDFGVSIGLTSPTATVQVDTGDDPVPSLANPFTSHGFFALGPGNHSITITPTASDGGGAAYLQVNAVPEPSSLTLMGLGALGLFGAARLRRAGKSSVGG